jgi:hypothetical protein
LIFDGVDGPQSIKLADIDQDGDLDAFTAGAWDDSFWFHQNQGAGTFMTFLITDSANNAARVDVMDVDGDQQLDVVGTSSLDDSLRWFNRTGVQFTEILIDNQLDGALALRVDDLNLDGYDDILVGSFFGNSISSFINNGFGSFNHQLLSVDKLKPTSILSADIDNDLDVDIVFNASQDNKVWLLNNNAGVFEEVLVHDRLTTVYSLVFTDFESAGGKGVIDVSDQEGVVYINKNNDNTVFTPKVLFQVLYGIRKIINLSGDEAELPQFALASNRGNSIQLVTRSDMIFKSGFDYNIAKKTETKS